MTRLRLSGLTGVCYAAGLITLVSVFTLEPTLLLAQETGTETATETEAGTKAEAQPNDAQPNNAQQSDARKIDAPEQALKYHQVLRQRPEPGYLFDRFYNAWLEQATADKLGIFLREKAASGETADRLLLAFFYAKQGKPVEAVQVLREALAKDPGNATTLFHKAELEARTLDFDTALEDLKNASQAEPTDKLAVDIAKLRGKLLARSGKREEARDIWQELLKQHPDDEFLYEDLIQLQLDEGLYDAALATSEALLKHTDDPYKRVLRQLRIGDIHQRAGHRKKALDTYAATIENVGADTWLEREICAQIEQVFRREDDLTGLNDFYANLLEKHKQRITLYKRRARLLVELGNLDEATKTWKHILDLTPGDRANREAYAQMLANAGQLDEAIKQVQALIDQHPDDRELQVRLAKLQHEHSQDKAAAATLQKYLDSSDGSMYAYLRTARLLEQFKLMKEAEQVFQQLRKAHADKQAAHEAWAEFLYRQGRKDEAKQVWIDLAKDADGSHVLRVARALGSRGENEAAFAMLRKRYDELSDDSAYLNALCEQALLTDRAKEALPWAHRRVRLAKRLHEMEDAISQTAQLAVRAKQEDALIEKLFKAKDATIGEMCLMAEMLERIGDSEMADEALKHAEEEVDDPQPILAQRIRLLRQRRNWLEAAKVTERLITLPGQRRPVHMRQLVELYASAGEVDTALKWIPQWKQLAPASADPWLKQSELLMRRSAGRGGGDPSPGIAAIRGR